MVRRMHQRSDAAAIVQSMVDLSKEYGQPEFVGKYKKLPRGVHVFFKADRRRVDHTFLQSLGISWNDYKENWEHADNSWPPKFGANQAKYYSDILAQGYESEEMYPAGVIGINEASADGSGPSSSV